MADEFLRLHSINKSFVGVNALKNVSLSIRRGEVLCLAGENGCGKSTLIKIISGVYAPDEGEIIVGDKRYSKLTPADAIQMGIEVIYQDFALFSNLSVAENIALSEQIMKKKKCYNKKSAWEIADGALKRIHVDLDLSQPVEELTVAEKQVVAIARAISHNARLIIMDEPTTALTQKEVEALFQVILELKKDNISVIFVSHKIDEILHITDRIIILRNGEKISEGNIENYDKSRIIYEMTGRVLKKEERMSCQNRETELLTVRNLSLKGGFADISFSLYKGEILGITGLLGSGRTALANALFGIHRVDSGEIFIEGNKVFLKSIRDAMKYGVGYVPEDRLTEGLFLNSPVDLNIAVSNKKKIVGKFGLINKKKISDEFNFWKERLKIKVNNGETPAKVLSGGNQQKVVIAKWLATDPKILILNGPTVGVDIGSKADIIQILRSLADKGIGVIIVSDDISEIMSACDRILVMKSGRMIQEYITEDITEEILYECIRNGVPA